MEWWETLLEVPLCQLGVWLRSITYHKGRGCYISGSPTLREWMVPSAFSSTKMPFRERRP